MSKCECLAECIFFNDKMSSMPAMAAQLKEKYCMNDNSGCARYQVFKALGKEKVPPDLFPSQTQKASAILAG